MIRPIHPVQDFKNLSTGKKVALTAAAAGAVGLTIAAAIKGGKTLQEPDIKLLSKIGAGYKEMFTAARTFTTKTIPTKAQEAYNFAKTFATEKGGKLKEQAQKAYNFAKDFATEKGGKLKEKAQALLTSLKEKLPQKAEEVIE